MNSSSATTVDCAEGVAVAGTSVGFGASVGCAEGAAGVAPHAASNDAPIVPLAACRKRRRDKFSGLLLFISGVSLQ
jgi:hypothetical protein